MMLEFGIELCQIQRRAGRGFLFEHPLTASSWEVGAVQQLQSEKGVLTSVFEMCQFGMRAEDAHGLGLVRKSTQILTNVDEAADYLSRRCPGGHRHVHLVEGRARAAAVYPERMCEAVVKAVQLWQARRAGGPDRRQLFEFSRSDLCEPVESKRLDDVGYFLDDIKGEPSDPGLARRDPSLQGAKGVRGGTPVVHPKGGKDSRREMGGDEQRHPGLLKSEVAVSMSGVCIWGRS